MGNHSIGRAFVAAVTMAAKRKREDETALAIFDEAAELTEIRGADAEFDDAFNEDGPFRTLAIKAFAPDFKGDDDEDGERFYEAVYRPFRERYGLC